MGAPHRILCPHGVLDAVHLLLVAAAVHHGSLLRVPQCSLQGLNSLSSRPKTFLQLWKLTAQICIVTNQLTETRNIRGRKAEREGVNTTEKNLVLWLISATYCTKALSWSVPHLFVNLCKLVQVILKKGNLLLLGARPPAIIRFHFGTLQQAQTRENITQSQSERDYGSYAVC